MTRLIKVSEDCPVSASVIPQDTRLSKTLPVLFFEELIKNPYFYTEKQLIERIHLEIRKKSGLKLESYSIRRNPLLKKYGRGIHMDEKNRLALVACDGGKYKALLADASVTKVNAYKNSK